MCAASTEPPTGAEGKTSRALSPSATERAVLCGLIKPCAARREYYSNIASTPNGLTAEHFSVLSHKNIFRAMGEVNDEHAGDWDSVVLLQQLAKHRKLAREGKEADKAQGETTAEYIAELMRTEVEAETMLAYCKTIIESWRWRVLGGAHDRARGLFQPGGKNWAGADMPAVAAMEKAQDILMKAEDKLRAKEDDEIYHIGDLGGKMFAELVEAWNTGDYEKYRGLYTSIWQFDKATAGLRPGEMTVIAARPNVGKTALGIFMALRTMTNARIMAEEREDSAAKMPGVYFVSAEMEKDEILARMFAMTAKVDSRVARDPEHALKNDKDIITKLSSAQAVLNQYPFYVDGRKGKLGEKVFNIMEIRKGAQRVMRQHKQRTDGGKLGLIVVDYIQIIGGDPEKYGGGKPGNTVDEIENVATALKAIGRQTGAAILAISQLSRRPDGRPSQKALLSDLRGSGAIEQVADFVLFMDDDGTGVDSNGNRGLTMNLEKNRYGEKGVEWHMKFQPRWSIFDTQMFSHDKNGNITGVVMPPEMWGSKVWTLGRDLEQFRAKDGEQQQQQDKEDPF